MNNNRIFSTPTMISWRTRLICFRFIFAYSGNYQDFILPSCSFLLVYFCIIRKLQVTIFFTFPRSRSQSIRSCFSFNIKILDCKITNLANKANIFWRSVHLLVLEKCLSTLLFSISVLITYSILFLSTCGMRWKKNSFVTFYEMLHKGPKYQIYDWFWSASKKKKIK